MRVEMVRIALADVFPQGRQEWIDSLQRDLNPEQQVNHWERIAGSYLEFITLAALPPEEHNLAFKIILGLLSGLTRYDLADHIANLPKSAITHLAAVIYRNRINRPHRAL
jgi:hypothetical protein